MKVDCAKKRKKSHIFHRKFLNHGTKLRLHSVRMLPQNANVSGFRMSDRAYEGAWELIRTDGSLSPREV